MDFNEYFYYDESSPSGLRWKVKLNRKIVIGSPAGSRGRSSWSVRLFGRLYRVHRIIYELLNTNFNVDFDIDHIDRNPFNNKIENLRCVSHSVNMRNLSLNKNNTSGVTGVAYKEIYDKRKDYLYKGWRAEWRGLDGKNCTKLFSVRKYGYDEAFRLACEHREKMINELNERGAGYSPTHGK